MSLSIGAEASAHIARADAASAGNSALQKGRRHDALDAPGPAALVLGTGSRASVFYLSRQACGRYLMHAPIATRRATHLLSHGLWASVQRMANVVDATRLRLKNPRQLIHRARVRRNGLPRDVHRAIARAWRLAPARA